MRIGHGYDVHRFGPGDHVMLAGVRVPCEYGVIAHSDGDVLIHALCDALLGAAGLGDIGQHFPDTDPAYENADSRKLLARVLGLLESDGLAPLNVDLTLVAQTPKVAAHIPAMRETLAKDLGLPLKQVNIKATTTEKLGPIGRREGLAAHAVVLLSVVDA